MTILSGVSGLSEGREMLPNFLEIYTGNTCGKGTPMMVDILLVAMDKLLNKSIFRIKRVSSTIIFLQVETEIRCLN
jgi:hypothetical protein